MPDYPLPIASDYPSCLTEAFLPLISTDPDNEHFIRLVLSSCCISFNEKRAIIESGLKLTKLQRNEIQTLMVDDGEYSLKSLHKYAPARIASSASAICESFLLARWFGVHPDLSDETVIIRSIITQACSRGLTDFLLHNVSTSWWETASISSYVFRHALPPKHQAWLVGERADFGIFMGTV